MEGRSVTTMNLVDPQGTLLREIADSRLTRDDVVLTYAFALRQHFDTRCDDRIDFAEINHAIVDRWSLSALKYIKTKAWKRYEAWLAS